MRLPNGYGSIVKLSGNRRRPYIARKTTGYNDKHQPIYYIIGYFESRNKALQALADYNRIPSVMPCVTLASVVQLWLTSHKSLVSDTTFKGYSTTLTYLNDILPMPITSIKFAHLQSTIDEMSELSYSSKKKVRSLLHQVFNYAMTCDIIASNPCLQLSIGKNIPIYHRRLFTRQQINRIKISSHPIASYVLVLLYTGLRVNELLNLKPSDINHKRNYIIVRKAKTEAGTNRIIPLHPVIQDHINCIKPMSYSVFRKKFNSLMRSIGCTHTSHECRHTFASLLNSAGANYASIRYLLGHKHGDITLRVYTHSQLRDLRKAIMFLK